MELSFAKPLPIQRVKLNEVPDHNKKGREKPGPCKQLA
jgi:hypothetical protein